MLAVLFAAAGARFVFDFRKQANEHLDVASLVLAAIGLPLFVFDLGEVAVDALVGTVALAIGIAAIALFMAC